MAGRPYTHTLNSIVLPRATDPTTLLLLRSDESDDDSLLAVNYAGFAPVLVEGLKELEQQQRLEIDEAQDEIQRLKEVAEQQRSELGVALDEIQNLKELAGQLLQFQTEQQEQLESISSRCSEVERELLDYRTQ